MKHLKQALLAATLLAGTSAAVAAAPVVGLVDGTWLVTFDSEARNVTAAVEISGVERVIGIDLRPSDGKLYGVTPDGWVVTLDPASGAATPVVQLKTMLPAGVGAIVDFNPAADKLRLMGSDGTNLRADLASGEVVTDGRLAFKAEDMHAGETPAIVAAAYSNAYGKPEKTAMYDIDATIVALLQQAPPNDGLLSAIGKLGIAPAEAYAFDIQSDAALNNTAWLAAGGTLYRVDLATGTASEAGPIAGLPGTLADIAVLP